MSWLTVRKILPPFFTGEPPIYELAGGDTPRPPVAWNIYFNERQLGWAVSEINYQTTDTTEIHSLVHFDSLPLDELLPVYLHALARAAIHSAGSMEMEVESDLITNPLNQLVSFYSKFRPKSGQSLVKIEGNVDGDKLKISVHVGNYDDPNIELPMPEHKIRDSFAPEMELRGLHLGQSWTIFAYSPLALPTHPMDVFQHRPPTEVLYAKVELLERLIWNGQLVPAWVVVYRTDTSDGPGSDKNIRNRLWVCYDGTVIRQEVLLGDYSLQFARLSEGDAVRLRDKHEVFQRRPPAAQP